MGNPHQPKREMVKKKTHKLLLIESCTNRVLRECDVGYPKRFFLSGIVKIPLIWTIPIFRSLRNNIDNRYSSLQKTLYSKVRSVQSRHIQMLNLSDLLNGLSKVP